MKSSFSKGLLMTVLITGSVMWGGTNVFAEELQEYTLDQMVVTATRTETRDVATPATTTIIKSDDIKKAGYKNVFDIIDNQLGMASTGYGDAGQEFGFSSGRSIVRGFDRGTLVMVDGIPMNLKNYNSADTIPAAMVERVEIVRGASGTLYGAEAMGGVINIITKRPAGKEQIKVSGTVGNYYKDYGVALTSEKFMISAGKEYSDKYTHSNDYPYGSNTDWWIGKGQKERVAMTGELTDELRANFFYSHGDITRGGHKYASKPVDYDEQVKCDIQHDRRWTAEACFNLLDNAIKYGKTGSEIVLSVRKLGLTVEVSVTDENEPIGEDERTHIFERFYRGRNSGDKDGVGIGLYLSREIIEKQGGMLSVISQKDGNKFVIVLQSR